MRWRGRPNASRRSISPERRRPRRSAFSAAGVSRILLVTSSAHAWRASHEFASAGIAVVPAPVGVWAPRESGLLRYLPGPGALARSSAALYELLGDLVRRALAALRLRTQES